MWLPQFITAPWSLCEGGISFSLLFEALLCLNKNYDDWVSHDHELNPKRYSDYMIGCVALNISIWKCQDLNPYYNRINQYTINFLFTV